MKSNFAYEDLIGKYLSGNISSAEKRQLFAWVEKNSENRVFFDQMVELWSISTEYEEEKMEVDTQNAWNNIEHNFQNNSNNSTNKTTAKVVQFSPFRQILKIAAILIPLIIAAFWLFSDPAIENSQLVLTTLEDEKLDFHLPDGSRVWLNENSSLTFDTNFLDRTVVLEGEAFFDVTKMEGKKFEILSGDAKTTVFGTSFNVRAYPTENLIEVTVESGVVELSKKEIPNEKVKLKKGDSGIYKKAEKIVEKEVEAIVNANAWKTQTFNFEMRKMGDIINSFERFFETEFEVENKKILNCTFKIKNLENPDIQTIKELIEFETNGNILLIEQGNRYIFKGQGCN